jgi:EmrB/QacA subfamily drug resistance transporter
MMIGFFMIMVDSTIVAIANPTIMAALHTGYDDVVWVTSAYLLGFAVVLLVAGRLGDRFGPKNVYLIGLAVFAVASMWCGLSGSVAMLIGARVVQGVGAGLLTPQTLSTITRIFPPGRRGVAVSVWGATAGVASLVGPLAGGLLVDGLGWEWIFFVNIPIGIVGMALAVWLVPALPVQSHQFDPLGVALSGVGMFLIVFGLQQGQAARWDLWIWAVIVAGVGFMTAFVYWQFVHPGEPLIPLRLFADRDFSLCSIGVGLIAFATTAMMLPLTFYAQEVCGLSPTRSALLIAPMAVANGVLAPIAGRIIDRHHPLPVLGFGFSALAISLTWLSVEMAPDTPVWRLVLPFFGVGAGMAFVWSPLTATATRNLPAEVAGAGSGVYNVVRQLGAVLGSAGMAAFMTPRIGAELPGPSGGAGRAFGDGLVLPEFLREPFAAAMSQSVLLPAFIALLGIVTALFLVSSAPAARAFDSDWGPEVDEEYDDDPYVEYVLLPHPDVETREPPARPAPRAVARPGPMPQFRSIDFAHNRVAARPAPAAPGRIFLGDRFAPPPPAARRRGSEGAHASGSRPGHARTERLLDRHDPEAPGAGRNSA